MDDVVTEDEAGEAGGDRGGEPVGPMGKLAATAVLDQLKRLEKRGNPAPLEHYRALKGHAAKRSFASKLSVDPEASFLTASETHEAQMKQVQRSFFQANATYGMWLA